MDCDHVVARFGLSLVVLSDFPKTYRVYNEQVDRFNAEYSKRMGKALPTPVPLACFPHCMTCGAKLDWETIKSEIDGKAT